MLSHEIDAASGVRLVGGEIPDWSDEVPSPGAAALAELVAASAEGLARGARVLLAGVPAVALRDRLPAGLELSLLVRGLPDARALAASVPEAQVVAGALDRLAARAESYDLVVALGGPESTLSPDSRQVDDLAWLRLVGELVRPGGRSVASVGNPVGLDRLIGVDTLDSATAWAPLSDTATAGLALDDLRALAGVEVLAAYPTAASPAVLLTAAEASTATGPAQLAVRALAGHFTGAVTVREAWRTTERLLEAGLGLALAPAWVVVSGVAVPPREPEVPARARLLESRLREAVGSRSHRRVRDVVASYAGWLGEHSGSTGATARPAGAPDLRDVVVLDDGGFTLMGASATAPTAEPATAEPATALRDGLAAFAERVCADGAAALWDAPTPDAVLTDLLAMAGHERPGAATAPEDERAGGARVDGARVDGAGAGGEVEPRPDPASREAEVRRLRDAEASLDETRRKVVWLEGTIRAKDRRIRTLERAIAIESSTAYKVVHQLGRPVPALKRRARSFLDRHGRG